jgi:hypothetical protein
LGPGVEHPAQAGLQRILHDSHGPVQVCARRQVASFRLIHVELNLPATEVFIRPPKRSIVWHLRIVSEHTSLR